MPVFTLHKYQPAAPQTPSSTPGSQETQAGADKPPAITIQASASVSALVAQALYATMSRQDDDSDKESQEKSAPSAQVPEAVAISTQDIEKDPVGALESASVADSVIILGRGFHTAKDEWILNALQARNKSLYFSVESFLHRHAGTRP